VSRALDPQQEHVANLKRRAAKLEQDARARDPLTGKSALAVAGGRAAGAINAERYGCSSAWGLRMALKRYFGVELPKKGRDT